MISSEKEENLMNPVIIPLTMKPRTPKRHSVASVSDSSPSKSRSGLESCPFNFNTKKLFLINSSLLRLLL
ncbi:hypothetical protein Bca4012_016977 [Brassica carinata]